MFYVITFWDKADKHSRKSFSTTSPVAELSRKIARIQARGHIIESVKVG